MDKTQKKIIEELGKEKASLEKLIREQKGGDLPKAREKLNGLLQKHKGVSDAAGGEVLDIWTKTQDFLTSTDEESTRLINLYEANQLLGKLNPILTKVKQAHDKKDGEAVLKLWNELKAKAPPLLDEANPKWQGIDVVQQFVQSYNEMQAKVDSEAQIMIDLKNANAIIGKCKPKLVDCKKCLDKSDGEGAEKYWKQLKELSAPLRDEEKFQNFDEVKAFLQEYQQLANNVEGDAQRLIQLKAAKAIISKASKPLDGATSCLSKEDGDGAKKHYLTLKELAKPFFEEGNVYTQFDEVNQFIAAYNDIAEKVDSSADHLIIKREMTNILTKCDKTLSELNTALSKQDGEKAKKIWRQLIDCATPFTSETTKEKYLKFEKVQEFLTKYEELTESLEPQADRMINEQLCQSVVQKCDKIWADGLQAKEKEDGEKMGKCWAQFQEIGKVLFSSIEGGPELHDKYKDFPIATDHRDKLIQLMTWVDAEVDRLVRKKQALGYLKPLKSKLADCKTALNKNDGAAAQKIWTTLQEQAKVITVHDQEAQKYSEFDEVIEFKKAFDELAGSIDGESDHLIRKKQAAGHLTICNKRLAELKKSLDKKDGEGVAKAWAEIKERAKPLLGEEKDKYSEFEEVQKFTAEYGELQGHIEEDAKALIIEKEAREIHKKASSLLSDVNVAISRKDGETAQKRWAQLQEVGKPLLVDDDAKYAHFDFVQQLIGDYKQLQETIEATTAGLINFKVSSQIVSKCQPLLESVSKALDKGDQAAANKHIDAINAKAQPLLEDNEGKYKDCQHVNKFIADYDQIKKRIGSLSTGIPAVL